MAKSTKSSKPSKQSKPAKQPNPTWYERDYERKTGQKLSKYGRDLKEYTINPVNTQIPKPQKQLSTRTIPTIGGILSVVLVILIVFVVHLKIMDKPYIGIAYWLEVFSECPITIDIYTLYNAIEPVELISRFAFLQDFVNFLIEVLNVFIGSIGILGNLLEMILWFVGKIFIVFSS